MESISVFNLSFLNIWKAYYKPGCVVDCSARPRPFNIFVYLYSGEGVVRGASGTVYVKAGDAFFIPLGETYISEWTTACNSRYLCICFYFAYENNPLQNKKYALQRIEGVGQADLRGMFERAAEAIGGHSSFGSMHHFYALCDTLFPRLSCTETPNCTAQIDPAIAYLHANFAHPVSVRRLAELCYLSESRFMHVFKKVTGSTVITYKNKLAIRHACRLLQGDSAKSIEEISTECGFTTAAYFRRVFTAQTGMSPRSYRKQNAI